MSKILSFLIIIFFINIDILSEEIETKVNKGSDLWVQETKSYINRLCWKYLKRIFLDQR